MPVHVCWNACLFPFRCTPYTDRRPFPSGTFVSCADRIVEDFFWNQILFGLLVFSCRLYGSMADPASGFYLIQIWYLFP